MNIIGKYQHSTLSLTRYAPEHTVSITRFEYERGIVITEVPYPDSANRKHRRTLKQLPQTRSDIEALEAIFGPVKIIKLEPL